MNIQNKFWNCQNLMIKKINITIKEFTFCNQKILLKSKNYKKIKKN